MLASVLSIPHIVFVAVAYRKSCCGLENINEDLLSSYKMRGNVLFSKRFTGTNSYKTLRNRGYDKAHLTYVETEAQ